MIKKKIPIEIGVELMPYIPCPGCSERIDISKISFTLDALVQLSDVIETDDEIIQCPHCKDEYIISIDVYFSDVLNISSDDYTYHDFLDIKEADLNG